jgi:DNA (cytosine-5)-methyltransferase 1
MTTNSKNGPTFISIFSGCGGFDIGFKNAGFRPLGAFDIDKVAIENYRLNLGGQTHLVDLSKGVLVQPPATEVDVLLAGPPCQGFSTAGMRKLDDPRNRLLLAAGKIAAQIRPKVCVIENVPGVAYGRHKKYWDDLEALLRSSGYCTAVLKCFVNKLGVAQLRKRLIMIAWRTGFTFRPELSERLPSTIHDAFTNLRGVANHMPVNLHPESEIAKIAQRINPGQKLSNVRGGIRAVHTWQIPEVFGRTNELEREILNSMVLLRRRKRRRILGDADPVSRTQLTKFVRREIGAALKELERKNYIRRIQGLLDLTHTFNGKFRRLRWDAPAPAVDTRFGSPRYFLHPSENRGFTVREAARLQGFPDSYVFVGSNQAQYRLIGNAVPPPVGEILAGMIRSIL